MFAQSLKTGTAAFAIVSFLLFQQTHAGYSMTPLVSTLDFSKNITSAEVVIKSEKGDAKIPMAIELTVKARDVDMNGTKVSYRDDGSDKNFVVYPSQIVLMPGENQRVQIKWVGDAIPEKETAYGLIAKQAPVKLGDEDAERTKPEGRIHILVRYEGAIVVIPPGAKPRIVVDSALAGKDKEGKNRLILLIRNEGTGRQTMKGMKLRVSQIDKDGKIIPKSSVSYTPKLVSQQIKQSLFPGYKRRLDLTWPPRVAVGPVRVTVEFE
ncbi:MAG: molecular chaperone [Chitinispirillaceae bacterium]|nr:molecular chaperone [Chitinispirillaceae bacterium]